MKTIQKYRRHDLNGENGLLIAVIAVAIDDALGRNGKDHIADAWRYFGGRYWEDLTLLDLPNNWLPHELEKA